MNVRALLKLGLVAGLVLNGLDIAVQGGLLAHYYTGPAFRDTGDLIPQLIATDFVAGFIFVWLYLRFGAVTGPGAGGGARFGWFAGMLYSFPMYFAMHLLFNGYSLVLAVVNTVYQVAAYVVAGLAVGALHRERAGPQ
jgi:hypothetical protein